MLTVAGVIIIAISGFLTGNTDLLGDSFESALVELTSAADRVDDLIIVIGVVTLLVGLFGQNHYWTRGIVKQAGCPHRQFSG